MADTTSMPSISNEGCQKTPETLPLCTRKFKTPFMATSKGSNHHHELPKILFSTKLEPKAWKSFRRKARDLNCIDPTKEDATIQSYREII